MTTVFALSDINFLLGSYVDVLNIYFIMLSSQVGLIMLMQNCPLTLYYQLCYIYNSFGKYLKGGL